MNEIVVGVIRLAENDSFIEPRAPSIAGPGHNVLPAIAPWGAVAASFLTLSRDKPKQPSQAGQPTTTANVPPRRAVRSFRLPQGVVFGDVVIRREQ